MFKKLTRTDLDQRRATTSFPEYAEFVSSLKKGEGGLVNVEEAGVSRQTVKNRLKTSADASGVEIKFIRSPQEEVLFEVVGKR